MKLFITATGIVQNEQGDGQYLLKIKRSKKTVLSVFDEFGVSELVTADIAEDGCAVSAFDVPVGILRDLGGVHKTADETIVVADGKISLSGEKVAEFHGENGGLTIETAMQDRQVLVIAVAAAVSYIENNAEVASEASTDVEEKNKNTAQNAAFDFINRALVAPFKKMNSGRRRSIICSIVAALGAVLMVIGVISTVSERSITASLSKTVGIVATQKGKTSVSVVVGGYRYTVPARVKDKQSGMTIDFYYTTDKNGRLKNYRLNPEPSNFGIYLAVFGGVLLLGGMTVLFVSVSYVGFSFKPMREKKPKPAQQTVYSRTLEEDISLSDIPELDEFETED